MTMRMASFAFGRRPEHSCHIVVAFDVRFLCEIEITSVSLGFACKGIFKVLFGLGSTK